MRTGFSELEFCFDKDADGLGGKYGDRFDFPVKQVKIATISSAQEGAARGRAGIEGVMSTTDELISESIVEVDYQPVDQPFHGFGKWPSWLMDVLRDGFNELNVAPKDFREHFLAMAKARAMGSAQQPSAAMPKAAP